MSGKRTSYKERCAELEELLDDTRREGAYYKSIAQESGQKLLREIQRLTKLIADYKRAEGKIRTLRFAMEQSTDGIAMADLTLKIYYVNESFAHMHGYPSREITGMIAGELQPEAQTDPSGEYLQKIMEEGSWSGEITHLRRDGAPFPIYVSTTLLKDESGQPAGILFVVRDITQQKKLESRLIHARKMEAVGILAGGVAHDLNNILAGLIGYPELLLMDTPEDSPYREPLLTVKKSGEKAAAIVKDLLTLSRRGYPDTVVTDFNKIISEYFSSPEYETLKSFHPDVEVTARLQPDLNYIWGSPVHLHKLVMNLVSNAAQAMPRGGKLFLLTEKRHIEKKMKGYEDISPGDYAVLVVSDTGKGIEPENVEKIFEPFYTKRALGRTGTGLGMSVVWATVKDHNGFIDIQSEPGMGTAFFVYLPVTDKKPDKETPLIPMEDILGKGEPILVVDDVREQREVACHMLKRLGYAVSAVRNGEEALVFFQDGVADLVVIDMIMAPGMDGLETYKKILELRPGQKAVIVSGFSKTDLIREAQGLGAGPYVKKPYSLQEIGLAVRNELKQY